MYGKFNKNNNEYTSSTDNVFNVSGQNIMSNNMNLEKVLRENNQLKVEINKKNKEIEDAKKRLNILQREIDKVKKQKNNTINGNKNRGRSVGIRNNINLNNNYNRNNNYNNNYNNYNNNNNMFSGGMFNDNDPFNDPFFKFDGESRKNDNSGGDSLMDDQYQYDF